MRDDQQQDYRCVEPAVGERILDLVTPGCDDVDHDLLTAHVEICAHCRLTLDLERSLIQGLQDESRPALRILPARHDRIRTWSGWLAAGSLAAGLALVALLPPRSPQPRITPRGETTGFVRPVEGEVVAKGDLELAWRAVPGAYSYEVVVADPDAGAGESWAGATRDTSLVIPAAALDAGDGPLRAVLAVVPEDVLGPGRISVAFRTGSPAAVAWYRLTHARIQAAGVLGFGLLAGLVFLVRPLLGRSGPGRD